MYKISVIVPVFNAERYLKRCVESIINQTFLDFELILVDDGSSDNSGKICDEYAKKDKRICAIHSLNNGVSQARNIGINEAKGKYIAFCDSDDYIDSGFLQHAYDICENNHIGLYKTSYYLDSDISVKKSGSIETPQKYFNSLEIPEKDFTFLVENNYLTSCCTSLFRRDIINRTRFDVNMVFGEDVKFVFDILNKNYSVFVDNRYYYHYVSNPKSATSNISLKKCVSMKDTYLMFFDYSKRFPNGKIYLDYIEKRCADDIFGSIKKVIKGDFSFFQKRKMLDILLSEQVFIDSCLKYHDEYQNSKGSMSAGYILSKEHKRQIKHRIRRIKHRILK